MLGTQAQYPNQYPTQARPAKGRSWRKALIVVALLALVGIGGWWAYQNSMTGQSQSVTGPVGSGQAPVFGAGVSDTAAAGAQASTAATGSAAFSASAGQPAVQATTPADQAAAKPVQLGLQLASLAGVAEIGGTPVWSDDGMLLATLESGSILTVKARTSDGTWLAVATDAGLGWAQSSTVVAYGLHNLATATLPEAIDSANVSAGSITATIAAAVPGTVDASLSLADLVSSSSAADGSQPASAQLTATIAARGSRLNVRSGPGTDYQVVAKAGDGTEYQAVGRSATGDWLLLSSNGSNVGWVSGGYVEVSGDIQTLPIENA